MKMSDVFNHEIAEGEITVYLNPKLIRHRDAEGKFDCADRYAAHAINCHDELVKEIESDIEWLEQIQGKFPLGSYEFRSCSLRIEFKRSLLAKARGEA